MYDSVKKGVFNVWAILFGYPYFVYRNMYLFSVIIIIIIICKILSYLVGNLSFTFIGLLFCPIYKLDITRKIKKIKSDNPNADEEQLLLIAKNKGGTSIIGTIVFMVIYLFIILFIEELLYNLGIY